MLMIAVSVITILILIVMAFAVIFKKHRKLSNAAFFAGMLSTAILIFGDSMSVLMPDMLDVWKRVALVSETIMAPSWLLFTLSFARTAQWRSINNFSRLLLLISPFLMFFFMTVPVSGFFYSPEFESEGILFLENAGYLLNLLLLFYSILSMVNLETTLRSSGGGDRWHIKYMLIGVGGIIAVNIFYYSQALLYRSINMNLLPVRTGVIMISSLFMGFALLKGRVMDVEVAISRRFFYRSLSIFVVGLYLLGLGMIGQGMRYFGPEAGGNITIFLGFAGAILILTIILSEQLRRKAIVFINKNFYRQKYDYREQWLNFTERVSMKRSYDDLLQAIADGFKDALGVKGTSVWLRERGNDGYICMKTSEAGVADGRPLPGLIDFFNETGWILDIKDGNCGKAAAENEKFINETGASLIVPLFNAHKLLGFVLLMEDMGDNEYNYEDYDLLKTLAKQAAAAVINLRLSEELTEAKEMEAMGRLSTFITHDLKNAASMLSLTVQNAEDHIDNPEFQKDAIMAIAHTSDKINSIINKIKNLPQKLRLNLEYSDLSGCVRAVIKDLKHPGQRTISFEDTKEDLKTDFDREEISKIVINLLLNAIDATDKQGHIDVSAGIENDMIFVKVSDDGCGISEEFINKKLFRPFQTTKHKGLGIGLFQCRTIAEAHGGTLKVLSEEGKGTEFTLYLPLSGKG